MEAQSFHMRHINSETISKNLDDVHIPSSIIKLNVGGQLFQTTLDTLTKDPNSLFPLMFSGKFDLKKDDNGAYFIDRDGKYFRHILNFLRIGQFLGKNIIEDIREELAAEADFYQIQGLTELLNPTFEVDESVILTDKVLTEPFRKWLPFDQRKWFRIYGARKDGWGADVFHKFCDQAELTLIVIKCDKGHIFGGYTDQCWAGKQLSL